MQLDVAQFDCIRKFVDEFLAKDERLDILVISMPISINITTSGVISC